MDIKVSEIPEEGIRLEFVEELDGLAGLGEDSTALKAAKADFLLKKVGTTVVVTGGVDGALELVCSRCGKKYSLDFHAELGLDLNPVGSLESAEEQELRTGELDVEFYDGGSIDLTGIVREQHLLQAPMKPLCREDCRGLCQYCGQDKNEGECGCVPPEGHTGLAGLKALLEDEEKKKR